jgi:hypothetical protein
MGASNLSVLGIDIGNCGAIAVLSDSGELIDFGLLCIKLGVPYALCVGRDEPIRILEGWGVVRKAAA